MAENGTTQTAETGISLRAFLEGSPIEQRTPGGVVIQHTLTLAKVFFKKGKSGDPDPKDVDLAMFVNSCVEFGANPYLDEIWPVCIRGQWKPLVAAKTKLRKAHECKGFKGFTCGWITKDGTRHKANAECKAKPDEVIGAWCEIHRADEIPLWHELFLTEYGGGEGSMGKLTKLQKCVRDQAVRLKYPELMSGAYTENEIDYYEKPEPAYDSTTPPRSERKQAEEVTVTDKQPEAQGPSLKDRGNNVRQALAAVLMNNGITADAGQLEEAMIVLAAELCGCDKGVFLKPESWTADVLTTMAECVGTGKLTDGVRKLFSTTETKDGLFA